MVCSYKQALFRHSCYLCHDIVCQLKPICLATSFRIASLGQFPSGEVFTGHSSCLVNDISEYIARESIVNLSDHLPVACNLAVPVQMIDTKSIRH